jgi:hypothetical protein
MSGSQEFHLKDRKDVASRSSFGPGFSFVDEDGFNAKGLQGAPHINRSRNQHDTEGPIAAERAAASHAGPHAQPSSMQSTYQAMIAGHDGQPMKRTGKKTFSGPSLGSTGGSGGGSPMHRTGNAGSSFFGGTPGWTEPLRPRDESKLGTTQASGHVAGYTGHIPVSSTTKAPTHAPRDPQEKGSLIIENYSPYPG